jgi:hypothetical protein
MTYQQNSFSDDWKFASEVMSTIDGAVSYVIRDSEPARKFRSGRKILEISFYDNSNVLIQCRDGMPMVSKKTGKSYEVCSTRDPMMNNCCSGTIDIGAEQFGCAVDAKCTTA